MEAFKEIMDRKVKVVSMVHTNNVSGVTIPVREISELAHDNGALMVVDGAQSAPHMHLDMERMGVLICSACPSTRCSALQGWECFHGRRTPQKAETIDVRGRKRVGDQL